MKPINISFESLKEMTIGEVRKIVDDLYSNGWESDDRIKEAFGIKEEISIIENADGDRELL